MRNLLRTLRRRSALLLSCVLVLAGTLVVTAAPAQAAPCTPWPGCFGTAYQVTGTPDNSLAEWTGNPSSGGTVVRSVANGTTLVVGCQANDGPQEDGKYNATNVPSKTWDFTWDPGLGRYVWVYDWWMNTPPQQQAYNWYSWPDDAHHCNFNPPAPNLPPMATNVTATATGTDRVHITWHDNSGGTARYQVGNGSIAQPSTPLPAGTTSYDWTGLLNGTSLCFNVLASNSAGSSGWSASSCATTWRTGSGSSWRPGTAAVVLIHGVNNIAVAANSGGYDCSKDAWGSVVNYIHNPHEINGLNLVWGGAGGAQDIRTLKYYDGDTNCGRYTGTGGGGLSFSADNDNENLNNSRYTSHCSGYWGTEPPGSADGSDMESIYRLSCLLNWYLALNFGSGSNVDIVDFSMGGLITRNAIYQVQQSKATSVMPAASQLPHIPDVVTLETPHGGAWSAVWACCTQGGDMTPGSQFMNEMYDSAQNPQAPGGTDWTLEASEKDGIVGSSSGVYMDGGHKSYFKCVNNVGCYDHGGMMGDTSDAYDATISWCDGGCANDPHAGTLPWNAWSSAPRAVHHMMYALWLSSW